MKDFYDNFEPEVERSKNDNSGKKVGERELGTDPNTGRKVFVKIGRYGPMVQIGTAEEEEKPMFATIRKTKTTKRLRLKMLLSFSNFRVHLANSKTKKL